MKELFRTKIWDWSTRRENRSHVAVKKVFVAMMNEDRLTVERVYREYYPRILGYVRSKLSSPQEAEDVCSSAMLKIVRGLPTFDPEKSSLSTWIYTIVRNTLTDHYRSRRSHEELGEDIPYEGDDFEEILQEERLEELAAALEKLPQRERDVIILHYYSGISLREISEAIGMSYSNMKIIHRKALAGLKKHLDI